MITVTDATRSILLEDDIALQAMHLGWLNLSAFAESILPLLEERTFKDVKKGTAVVALSRIAEEISGSDSLRPLVRLDDLSIKSPLCDISFNKTGLTRKKLANLYQHVDIDENAFLTLTQSMSEITIIAPQSLLEDILRHFDEEPKAIYRDRVGITVRFSKEYLPIPNILYTLQAALAVHKINFTEVISTYTEFSFIINKVDLEIATQALQKFLR
jgi:aspartokinase